jgi:hypothetical protein
MRLTTHLKANAKFFEEPVPKQQWKKWIEDNIVRGKIVGDKIFIDVEHFEITHIMKEPKEEIDKMEFLL